jgi:hypothetical protein
VVHDVTHYIDPHMAVERICGETLLASQAEGCLVYFISYLYLFVLYVRNCIYKMSECGKQLLNKAICDGQIANSSVPRTDIAECVSYTYRESTHGFRDSTAC